MKSLNCWQKCVFDRKKVRRIKCFDTNIVEAKLCDRTNFGRYFFGQNNLVAKMCFFLFSTIFLANSFFDQKRLFRYYFFRSIFFLLKKIDTKQHCVVVHYCQKSVLTTRLTRTFSKSVHFRKNCLNSESAFP